MPPSKRKSLDPVTNGESSKIKKGNGCACQSSEMVQFDSNTDYQEEWAAVAEFQNFIKIDDFNLYFDCKHLCTIEELETTNRDVYLSGIAMHLLDDPQKRAIPIKDVKVFGIWNYSDDGTSPLFGITSAEVGTGDDETHMDYHLESPSENYRELFLPYKKMVYLLKAVKTELLTNPNITFDKFCELDIEVPEEIGIICEDFLLEYGKELCAHLENLDTDRDDDDFEFSRTNFFLELKSKVSYQSKKVKVQRKKVVQSVVRKIKEPKEGKVNVPAQTTPITVYVLDVSNKKVFAGTVENGDGEIDSELDDEEGEYVQRKEAKKPVENRVNKNLEIDFSVLSSSNRPDNQYVVYDVSNNMELLEKDKWFCGDPIGTKDGVQIYSQLTQFGNKIVKSGQFAKVRKITKEKNQIFYCRIHYFTANSSGTLKAHVSWLMKAQDTVLSETFANEEEEYFFWCCSDVALCYLSMDYDFTFFHVNLKTFQTLGGKSDANLLPKTRFVRQWYNTETHAFYYAADFHKTLICPTCKSKPKTLNFEMPGTVGNSSKKIVNLNKFTLRGVEYKIGSNVLLDINFQEHSDSPPDTSNLEEPYDPVKYPERRRKNDTVKGSNDNTPKPYSVGRIMEISFLKSDHDLLLSEKDEEKLSKIKLKIRKFFRPEKEVSDEYSSRMLYCSDEIAEVTLENVEEFCMVVCKFELKSLKLSLDEYLEGGPARFFFDEAFIAIAKKGSNQVRIVETKDNKKPIVRNDDELKEEISSNNYPDIIKPLRSLDLFAGCGGLSRGLDQCGLAEPCWAVEFDSSAAKAFQENFPNAVMFQEDVNAILRAIKNGEETYNGKELPKAGQVDLLCGGPPCQGFSAMNRFTDSEYSKFRNSLVVTFCGLVDVLRPKFAMLENVRNFLIYKSNMVLQLCARILQRMGYQVRFGCLQAGSYGVPQTRNRGFIFAAAPGEILPDFPLPTHCFDGSKIQLNFRINGRYFCTLPEKYKSGSGHFKTITVKDAWSDLPPINCAAENHPEKVYGKKPTSYYQKQMRACNSSVLIDHVAKGIEPTEVSNQMDSIRISRIPKNPGADWRNLPNESVTHVYFDKRGERRTLVTEVLKYRYGEKVDGRFTGVCTCNEGKLCSIKTLNQKQSVIPWCLPHTADRHGQWAGLYGRLDWDGFISTVTTFPHPMGKQGRVLHPIDNRVFSVREYARGQGFPDHHKFYGSLPEKYRQVGNAVPCPLAFAVGMEFKKSVFKNMNKK